MMFKEFYMVIIAQAIIIGVLGWVNFTLYRRIGTLESTIKLLDKSVRRLWSKNSDEEKMVSTSTLQGYF